MAIIIATVALTILIIVIANLLNWMWRTLSKDSISIAFVLTLVGLLTTIWAVGTMIQINK